MATPLQLTSSERKKSHNTPQTQKRNKASMTDARHESTHTKYIDGVRYYTHAERSYHTPNSYNTPGSTHYHSSIHNPYYNNSFSYHYPTFTYPAYHPSYVAPATTTTTTTTNTSDTKFDKVETTVEGGQTTTRHAERSFHYVPGQVMGQQHSHYSVHRPEGAPIHYSYHYPAAAPIGYSYHPSTSIVNYLQNNY